VQVDEIPNFSQDDLVNDDVMILDAGSQVFVWVGRNATDAEKAAGVSIAEQYVAAAAQVAGRNADTPVVRVDSGEEPPAFTSNFVGWSFEHASSISDPYVARLEELRKERDAAALRKAAADDEAAAARANAALEAERAIAARKAEEEEAKKAQAQVSPVSKLKPAAVPAPAPAPAPVAVAEAAVEAVTAAVAAASFATPPGAGSFFPLADLIAAKKGEEGDLSGIDFARKELYLSDADFEAVFKVSKAAFAGQPEWKRVAAKKSAKLF
jgi:hypothetical protein